MKSLKFLIGLITALLLVSCDQKKEIPDAEITAIAKEAYVYGYPMVKMYKDMYVSAIDVQNPNFKKPFNEFYMSTRISTPVDQEKETARNDTPYGCVWLDLRREPLVMTVPAIQDDRYYSIQFTDLNSYNFDYVGTRTSGNTGGKFLIAGPNWKGEVPAGINRVIRSDTQFVHGLVRIQLFNSEDVINVQKIQESFRLEPLSLYAGTEVPSEPSPIHFPAYADEKTLTPEFFSYMNFVMQFASVLPDEMEIMNRFEKISVGPGKNFSTDGMPENEKKAYQVGIDEAIAELDAALKGDLIKPSDRHGTRTELKNNYLKRAFGAMTDLYGASPQEILSISYKLDSGFKILNGSSYYTIRFEKDQLPPTDAFWSLTLYGLPNQLLVENPINRYHINSNMVTRMVMDPVDGSVTIFIQKDLLGSELPAVLEETKNELADKTESTEPITQKIDNVTNTASTTPKNAEATTNHKEINTTPKTVATAIKPDIVSDKKDVTKQIKTDAEKQVTNNSMVVKPEINSDQKEKVEPVSDNQQPNQLSANWLPAPESDFYMVLRIYIPKDEVLNGTWKAPVVVRFNVDGTPAENLNETGDTKPAEEKQDEVTNTSATTNATAEGKVTSLPSEDAKLEKPVVSDTTTSPVAVSEKTKPTTPDTNASNGGKAPLEAPSVQKP